VSVKPSGKSKVNAALPSFFLVALTAHVGPWLLLQFYNHFYTYVRTPWTSHNPSQGHYLHTGQHKHRIKAYTNINTFSGICIHDPSVRGSENSSCLKAVFHQVRCNAAAWRTQVCVFIRCVDVLQRNAWARPQTALYTLRVGIAISHFNIADSIMLSKRVKKALAAYLLLKCPVRLWGCSPYEIPSPGPVLHGTKWLLWRPHR
jgi:hypothetical protein